jgi:hypothetical protein
MWLTTIAIMMFGRYLKISGRKFPTNSLGSNVAKIRNFRSVH